MTNEQRNKLAADLQEALGSFAKWMNRPVKRAQVATWQVACEICDTTDKTLNCFRCLPAYRDKLAKQARFNVAQVVKYRRQRQSIKPPTYNEAKAEYEFNKA